MSSVFQVNSTSNGLHCSELFVLRAFLSNVVFAFVQRHGSQRYALVRLQIVVASLKRISCNFDF